MANFINRKQLENELDTKLQFHYKSKTISFFDFGYKNNNINLDPKYQRGQVWCNDGKIFLINSLLSGISIPPIILNQKDINTEKYDVIDGKQRLTTILDFINNKFPLNINNKQIYFDNIPENITDNDDVCIFDESYREYFKQIEVQVTFYIALDEIKQREIFERINYGSPLKYGEKMKGSNSPALYLIENLIDNFSNDFDEIGIKNDRNNYYLKFGTIICLTNRDFKSASSGSPILKYFNNWNNNEEDTNKILEKTTLNINKLVELYNEINKYNIERSPKRLSKHLWNWSELLFNIYCINENLPLKDLIKFNKFLYY